MINKVDLNLQEGMIDADIDHDQVTVCVSYRVRKSSEYADCYGVYSGFYSTSLLFGMGCVDGPGSLSGGAFNQLKLVTLDNVRTFLY